MLIKDACVISCRVRFYDCRGNIIWWGGQCATMIKRTSTTMIINLNALWHRRGDRHNKSLCTGTTISSISWILHTSGGTFTSKGLWRNCVGGDWYFLNQTGTDQQWLAASLHQLVASSPGHMSDSLRAHARTHTEYRHGPMTDKNILTLKALQVTRPGTMFSVQTLDAHGIPGSITSKVARTLTNRLEKMNLNVHFH